MFTQTNVEVAKRPAFAWNGWTLQLLRNDEGIFGVWTFRGQPVVMVPAGKA